MYNANTSSVFAVNFPARALCAQRAVTDRHRFLVGTCSLHDSNEISVLQYSEDSNHMEAVSLYSHPDQIWAIESSPTDPSLLVTSRQAFNGSKSLTLWRMDKQSTEDIAYGSALYHNEHQDLIELDNFNPSQKAAYVGTVRWHKTEDKLLSFDGRILTAWQISNDKVSSTAATMINQADGVNFTTANTAAAWDAHSVHSCAVGCGRQLSILDVRDLEGGVRRDNAHSGNIRDVDYNPNKPHTLVSCGEDRYIKFWDLRKLSTPVAHSNNFNQTPSSSALPASALLSLKGHSHWALTCRFNPFHDQLLLSGGSDQLVCMWRLASVSSSPWISSETATGAAASPTEPGSLAMDGDADDPPDVKVRAMDQHEESVYSVAWSAAEAWVYCSLSCEGRAIVNHVPSTEKYKILL